MPQCVSAVLVATLINDSPTKETAGTIVNGVTYFKRKPMIPIE